MTLLHRKVTNENFYSHLARSWVQSMKLRPASDLTEGNRDDGDELFVVEDIRKQRNKSMRGLFSLMEEEE